MSFNIWGMLPFGVAPAKDRRERLGAFGEVLPSLGLDVLCLQEVWMPQDQNYLAQCAEAAGLPYIFYFEHGLAGSGLMTCSRFPIIETAFQPFRLIPPPSAQYDFVSAKGIGLTRLQTPNGLLDVYNTHVSHQAKIDAKDLYSAYRAAALYQIAQYVNAYSATQPVIMGGDFNTKPDQLGYRLLAALGQLMDCYAALHPDQNGYTYSKNNFYNRKHRASERIDYIWVRDGGGLTLEPLKAEILLESMPAAPHLSYSDHYALRVELALNQGNILAPAVPEARPALREFTAELSLALARLHERREGHFIRTLSAFFITLFLALGNSETIGPKPSRLRMTSALLSLTYTLYQAALWLGFTRVERRNLRALAAEASIHRATLEKIPLPEDQ